MYESSSTSVKSAYGVTKYFRLLCKSFALIPYLFSVVMDEVKTIQDEVFWCMLFTADTVLVGEN